MIDTNLNESDFSIYEKIRNEDPASTRITYHQMLNIYRYCEEVKETGIQISDVYSNISTLLFGIVGVVAYLDILVLVFLFAALAICFYARWFFARKEEVYSIRQFADNIIRQMPLSKEETVQHNSEAENLRKLRVQRFIDHSNQVF